MEYTSDNKENTPIKKPEEMQTPEPAVTAITEEAKNINLLTQKMAQLKSEIHKILVGQEEMVDLLLITILSGGHALIEGRLGFLE